MKFYTFALSSAFCLAAASATYRNDTTLDAASTGTHTTPSTGNTTVGAGVGLTTVVYTSLFPKTVTVSSCAPTVTDCPYANKTSVTHIPVVYTTTYCVSSTTPIFPNDHTTSVNSPPISTKSETNIVSRVSGSSPPKTVAPVSPVHNGAVIIGGVGSGAAGLMAVFALLA